MTSSLRLSTIAVIALVALLLASAGCGRDPEPVGNGDDGLPELIMALEEDVLGLDVQQVSHIKDIVHGFLFTPLVSLGLSNDELLPWGAEAVEASDDGMELTITFDTSITFHDGEPVNAPTYKAAVERYLELSPYAFDFDPVAEMIVEDERTLVMKLSSPVAALKAILGSPYGAPVSIAAAEARGEEGFNRQAVGNGPFRVTEWVPDSHVTMVRYDDYRDNLPFVQNNGPVDVGKITVRIVPEDFTRVQELVSGNVDLIVKVPHESLEGLRANPDIEVLGYLNPNTRHIHMNTKRQPFDDPGLRLAVAYAISREQIATSLMGTIEPCYSIVSPAMISHCPDTETGMSQEFAHDPARARELLAASGWEDTNGDGFVEKDGQRLTVTLVTSSARSADRMAGPIIQAQLAEVGIDIVLREYETPYIREILISGDFDMALWDWSWIDPAGIWYYGLHSTQQVVPWSHPDVDALLDRIVEESSDEELTRLWAEITTRVWEDVPLVPLWSDRRFIAMSNRIGGIVVSTSGTLYINDMTVTPK